MAGECLGAAGRSGSAQGLSSLPARLAGVSGSLLVTLTFSGGLVLLDGADVLCQRAWGGFGVVPPPLLAERSGSTNVGREVGERLAPGFVAVAVRGASPAARDALGH